MIDRKIVATYVMKKKIHKKIDYLWKNGAMTRGDVYKMMKNFIGGKSFHVADLTFEQCKLILDSLKKAETTREDL